MTSCPYLFSIITHYALPPIFSLQIRDFIGTETSLFIDSKTFVLIQNLTSHLWLFLSWTLYKQTPSPKQTHPSTFLGTTLRSFWLDWIHNKNEDDKIFSLTLIQQSKVIFCYIHVCIYLIKISFYFETGSISTIKYFGCTVGIKKHTTQTIELDLKSTRIQLNSPTNILSHLQYLYIFKFSSHKVNLVLILQNLV